VPGAVVLVHTVKVRAWPGGRRRSHTSMDLSPRPRRRASWSAAMLPMTTTAARFNTVVGRHRSSQQQYIRSQVVLVRTRSSEALIRGAAAPYLAAVRARSLAVASPSPPHFTAPLMHGSCRPARPSPPASSRARLRSLPHRWSIHRDQISRPDLLCIAA
jgi:hypothetical protein